MALDADKIERGLDVILEQLLKKGQIQSSDVDNIKDFVKELAHSLDGKISEDTFKNPAFLNTLALTLVSAIAVKNNPSLNLTFSLKPNLPQEEKVHALTIEKNAEMLKEIESVLKITPTLLPRDKKSPSAQKTSEELSLTAVYNEGGDVIALIGTLAPTSKSGISLTALLSTSEIEPVEKALQEAGVLNKPKSPFNTAFKPT